VAKEVTDALEALAAATADDNASSQ
jgi:hypothetical protein